MEGGGSSGGLLYHEVQESKLCAVHCVNTVLQGPFFSEFDLAALASDLDLRERQMMHQVGGDFLSGPNESHNVSLDGDFSIQVAWRFLNVSLILSLGFFALIYSSLLLFLYVHLLSHFNFLLQYSCRLCV